MDMLRQKLLLEKLCVQSLIIKQIFGVCGFWLYAPGNMEPPYTSKPEGRRGLLHRFSLIALKLA